MCNTISQCQHRKKLSYMEIQLSDNKTMLQIDTFVAVLQKCLNGRNNIPQVCFWNKQISKEAGASEKYSWLKLSASKVEKLTNACINMQQATIQISNNEYSNNKNM